MIVVMKRSASEQDIEAMIKHVESLGLKPIVLPAPSGPSSPPSARSASPASAQLESGPGVDEVLPILAPYKLASRELKPEPTVVRAGSLTVGGGTIGVIAGPCSVENEEQIVATARAVKAAGATALRGGAFKPRTSPYSFQGLKEDGPQAAGRGPRRDRPGRRHRGDRPRRRRPGRRVRRRAADRRPQHAELPPARSRAASRRGRCCSSAAPAPRSTNCCWPPSTSSTPATPTSCSASAASARSRPTRASRCRWPRSPYLQAKTHLPVVVDPSHGTGHTYLVTAMARAAIAAGADGLIIEVHPDPDKAMSDGYQSLNFRQFENMMHECRRIAAAMDRELG